MLQEQDDDSSHDDLQKDPDWKSKHLFNSNTFILFWKYYFYK